LGVLELSLERELNETRSGKQKQGEVGDRPFAFAIILAAYNFNFGASQTLPPLLRHFMRRRLL